MKVLVKTKNVLLLGINGDVYEPNRPSVVTNDSFCQAKTIAGVVQLVDGDLPEEATDAEWLKFYVEAGKDIPLALEAFKSKYTAPEDIQEDVEKLEEEARLKDAAERNALEAQVQAEADAKAAADAELADQAARKSSPAKPTAKGSK